VWNDTTGNYSPIPAAAHDLNINLVPANESQKWKPALKTAAHERRDGTGNRTTNQVTDSDRVTDNASRLGDQDVLTARKVFERDIAETLIGAEKLGQNLDFYDNAQVIISSLQRNVQGGQWLAWQRCRGSVQHTSSYGVEGNAATGTSFPGIGVPGRYITASQGTAVMFVEVAFDYGPITPITVMRTAALSTRQPSMFATIAT